MAILLIGEKEKAAIRTAIERARRRPLPWDAGRDIMMSDRPVLKLDDRRPATSAVRARHRPEQVLIPIGYRAMVSFEQQPAGMCMHLSISVERKDPKFTPSVPAVTAIAQEFGIGPDAMHDGKVWMEEYEPGRHAVNIVVVTEPRAEGHA